MEILMKMMVVHQPVRLRQDIHVWDPHQYVLLYVEMGRSLEMRSVMQGRTKVVLKIVQLLLKDMNVFIPIHPYAQKLKNLPNSNLIIHKRFLLFQLQSSNLFQAYLNWSQWVQPYSCSSINFKSSKLLCSSVRFQTITLSWCYRYHLIF